MKPSRRTALNCLAIMAIAVMADSILHSALAQNPFGGPPAAPDAQAGGIVGWLLTRQSEFYREMSSTIRAARGVGIGAWLLDVTAKTMCGAERVIEIASYMLIAAFGVRLVWIKGGGLIRALQSSQRKSGPRLAPVLAHAAIQHHHGHHSHGD